jgi:hypothetical protein
VQGQEGFVGAAFYAITNAANHKEYVMRKLAWLSLSLGTICLIALAPRTSAQTAAPVAEKHDAKILRGALKDVVNAGAELFNKYGDHAGCYRLYQGALIAIKPFLGAATQKDIEDALTGAEALPRFSDRAFALPKMINTIRAQAAQGANQDIPTPP